METSRRDVSRRRASSGGMSPTVEASVLRTSHADPTPTFAFAEPLRPVGRPGTPAVRSVGSLGMVRHRVAEASRCRRLADRRSAKCEAESAHSCGTGSRRQRWFQPLDTHRCLSQKRFGQSAVDGNNVARGFGAVVAEEPHDSVGAVPRKNRAARQRALRIKLRELVPQVLG